MSRNYLLLLLVFISCSIHAIAQTDYYYYNDSTGKRTPIILNENKLVVSIPIDYEEICKRVRANVQALYWSQDNTFDFFFISRSDYEKLTSQDFWEEDAKSVIVTPSYIQDDDRGVLYQEIFALPYVIIHLKKNEDIDLLAPYLEKYRLKISWIGTWLTPYSVHLSLTLDSEKGPLEIANEMFESGEFLVSCPGWALAGSGEADPNTVRSITNPQQPSPNVFNDLQGRRMAEGHPLQRGIYVKDGRKFVVK